MDKTKVLIIAGTMHVGGQENQLMHILRHADHERFQIDYTSKIPDPFYRKEIEELGGRLIFIPEMSRRWPFSYIHQLYRIMKDGKYDVVHSNELFHSGIIMACAAAAKVKGRIAHSHNQHDIGGEKGLVRVLYHDFMRMMINRFATKRVACSSLAGQFLFGKGKDFQVVDNSVDTGVYLSHYYDESAAECREGWINVLQVGRIDEVKNQLFLVDIAEEFKRKGMPIRILVAGDGDPELKKRIQEKIQEKDVQEHMILLGTRKDIPDLLRSAKVFVLPSLFEGMPLAAIEAQASGLPCLIADTFSHEVDFGIGYVTWLKLEEGASVWADNIIRLADTPKADLQDVAQAIRKHHFDVNDYAEIFCRLYEEAAS